MSNGHNAADGFLSSGRGLGGWMASRDHKHIGLMFLGWILGAFLLGSIFALNLKLKALAGGTDPHLLRQSLTQHGLIMVFLFLVPAIPSTLGVFLLPLQLGAANLALPRFSQAALRLFVLGTVLFLLAVWKGAVAAGWTLVTPFSLSDGGAFTLMSLGLFCIAASWFLTGFNFIVTVHERRAPGMGFFDMPILSWSLYLTGYALVVVGALFGIVILYLASAKAFGRGLFSAGTNPLDWQNYFWFVTTPAAFFALLPAAGVISEVVAGVSRKAVTGYRIVVGSLIALLPLGFIGWGVHLVGMGQDPAVSFTFAVFNMLIAVPAALLTYCWLATLYRGAIACAAPTTFTVAFLLQAGIGVVSGLFLGSLSTGSYLGATLFATGHLHYLMMGGVTTALLAGLHYWWPKLFGRHYHRLLGRFTGFLYLVGVNLAFFPQLILGARGAVTGAPAAVPADAGLQTLSAVGMGILLLSLALIAYNLVSALINGRRAEPNPWGALTLEWQTDSPPPPENFR